MNYLHHCYGNIYRASFTIMGSYETSSFGDASPPKVMSVLEDAGVLQDYQESSEVSLLALVVKMFFSEKQERLSLPPK